MTRSNREVRDLVEVEGLRFMDRLDRKGLVEVVEVEAAEVVVIIRGHPADRRVPAQIVTMILMQMLALGLPERQKMARTFPKT